MALARGRQERGEKAVLILEDGEATAPRGKATYTYPGTVERTGYPVYQGKGAIRLKTQAVATDITSYALSGPSSHARLLKLSLLFHIIPTSSDARITFVIKLQGRDFLNNVLVRADVKQGIWEFWNAQGLWETLSQITTIPVSGKWHRVEITIDREEKKIVSIAVNEESQIINKTYQYLQYASTSTYTHVQVDVQAIANAAVEIIVDNIVLEEA